MVKPFTLKPIKNYRKQRVKACGNCKHLITEDYGDTLRCKRPSRIRAGKPRPYWNHNWTNHAGEVFEQAWTHVCDRWTKKDSWPRHL